jgi:hypothetical protein
VSFRRSAATEESRTAYCKPFCAKHLAKMIHCHNSTIHYIYMNPSIDAGQLFQIAEALEYDFFTEIYGNSLLDHVKEMNLIFYIPNKYIYKKIQTIIQ